MNTELEMGLGQPWEVASAVAGALLYAIATALLPIISALSQWVVRKVKTFDPPAPPAPPAALVALFLWAGTAGAQVDLALPPGAYPSDEGPEIFWSDGENKYPLADGDTIFWVDRWEPAAGFYMLRPVFTVDTTAKMLEVASYEIGSIFKFWESGDTSMTRLRTMPSPLTGWYFAVAAADSTTARFIRFFIQEEFAPIVTESQIDSVWRATEANGVILTDLQADRAEVFLLLDSLVIRLDTLSARVAAVEGGTSGYLPKRAAIEQELRSLSLRALMAKYGRNEYVPVGDVRLTLCDFAIYAAQWTPGATCNLSPEVIFLLAKAIAD
jgi:hypothetical protein